MIFFSFWQDFSFGECFLHEVIAEFVLPKKYLPELEKYILCIFLNILCMLFFSQFLNALKIVRFPIPYSKYPAVIICLYLYLFVNLSIDLALSLSIPIFIYLYLSQFPTIYRLVYLWIYRSMSLSSHLAIYSCIYLSIYLSIWSNCSDLTRPHPKR